MQMFKYLFTCLLFTLCLQSNATEIDSFSDRDLSLYDSLEQMNDIMNRYLDEALTTANKRNSCELQIIEDALAAKGGNIIWSSFEDEIEASIIIDKRRSAMEDSVYGGIGVWNGFALHLARLGFLMKVNGLFIGSDKFGHFFQQGRAYFDIVYRNLKTPSEAMDWGEMTERTYFGLSTTGIYSNADLTANYEGFLFWQRVTNQGLTRSETPYYTCKNNTWKRHAIFDWRDYISHAWDEGINCSRYRNAEVEASVLGRIQTLEQQRRRKLMCPIENRCDEIKERYRSLAPRLMTDKCL